MQPDVLVPADPKMAQEPARTIGQQFADTSFVKTLVGAVITIIGIVAPHLASGIDSNEANAISLVVVIVAGLIASWRARQVPKQQAAETREHVYAPATVASKVAEAQAGVGEKVDAVVIDAPPPTE